jgi:hypothetical protein
LVVSESKEVVKKAQALYDLIDRETRNYHTAKQLSRFVLYSQEVLIEKLQEEGVLNPRDAEVLIHETHEKKKLIENEGLKQLMKHIGVYMLSFEEPPDTSPRERSNSLRQDRRLSERTGRSSNSDLQDHAGNLEDAVVYRSLDTVEEPIEVTVAEN